MKLLFENTETIKQATDSIKNDLPLLTRLNNFVLKHDLGKLNHDMVRACVSNPVKVVTDAVKSRIPDEDPYTRLKVDKDKMLERMELPRFDSDLLRIININIIGKDHLELYDFTDKGPEVNEERLNSYMDRHRTFSDDPHVIAIFEQLNELAKSMNSVNKKLGIVSINESTGAGSQDHFFKSLASIFAVGPNGVYLSQRGFNQAIKV